MNPSFPNERRGGEPRMLPLGPESSPGPMAIRPENSRARSPAQSHQEPAPQIPVPATSTRFATFSSAPTCATTSSASRGWKKR